MYVKEVLVQNQVGLDAFGIWAELLSRGLRPHENIE